MTTKRFLSMMLVAAMMVTAGVANAENNKGGSAPTSKSTGANVSGTQTSRSSGTTFTSHSSTDKSFSVDSRVDGKNPKFNDKLKDGRNIAETDNDKNDDKDTRWVNQHISSWHENLIYYKMHGSYKNACFRGGEADLWDWLIANLKYPEEFNRDKIEGVVLVEFVITADGKVKDPTILRGLNPTCDRMAISLVRSMPDWNPAEEDGQPVDATFILPIPFK